MICNRCGAFLSQASGSFKLGKELLCRANSSGVRIFQTLPNAFFGSSLRGNIKKALVSIDGLHHDRFLAVHCQRHEAFASIHMLEKIAGRRKCIGRRLSACSYGLLELFKTASLTSGMLITVSRNRFHQFPLCRKVSHVRGRERVAIRVHQRSVI